MSSLAFRAKYQKFNLRYDELNEHLNSVKKKFGVRRVSSIRSLTSGGGDTRTFAEILDQEVEKMVLFFISMQGEIANKVWNLRSAQSTQMKEIKLSVEDIENYCQSYRDIGFEVLDLLIFLDNNVKGLRNIIRKYDTVFDHKVGSMYFDTRIGRDPKNSQLLQLYHQEGIRAVVATIRRGFEDMYDAKKALIDIEEMLNSVDYDVQFNGPSSGYGGSNYSKAKKKSHHMPRISYKNRLQSFSSFQNISNMGNLQSKSFIISPYQENVDKDNQRPPSMRKRSYSSNQGLISDVNENSLRGPTFFGTKTDYQEISQPLNTPQIKKSISDLEPILKKINDIADRVIKRKVVSASDSLAANSIMALEIGLNRDIDAEEEEEELVTAAAQTISASTSAEHDDHMKAAAIKLTARIAEKEYKIKLMLYINLYTTFLYMMNQYIVAPSSGQYSDLLGMSTAMSGVIIGLSPMASLFSSLVYSMWSNVSFCDPLIACIIFGILGNLSYAAALQNHSVSMLFVGRILTGLSGTRAITRRYIADHVPLKDLNFASSLFVMASALGLSFGPLLSSILQRLNQKVVWQPFQFTLVLYQNVTAPGWIMFILWIISLILVVLYAEEPAIKKSNGETNKKTPIGVPLQDGNPQNNLYGTEGTLLLKMNHSTSSFIEEDVNETTRLLSKSDIARYNPLHANSKDELHKLKARTISKSNQMKDLSTYHFDEYRNPVIENFHIMEAQDQFQLRKIFPTFQHHNLSEIPESSESPSVSTHSPTPAIQTNSSRKALLQDPDIYAELSTSRSFEASSTMNMMLNVRQSEVSKFDNSLKIIPKEHNPLPKSSLKKITIPSYDSSNGLGNIPKINTSSTQNSFETKFPSSNDFNSTPTNKSNMIALESNSLPAVFNYSREPAPMKQAGLTAESHKKNELRNKDSVFASQREEFTKELMPKKTFANNDNPVDDDLLAARSFVIDVRDYEVAELDDDMCCYHITWEVLIVLLIYLVNKAGQELSVSSIPTLGSENFAWNNEMAGYYMSFMGAIVLPTNVYVNSLMKDLESRDMILRLSYVTLGCAILVMNTPLFGYSAFQYTFANAGLFALLNATEGIIMALLSKIVPPQLAKGTFNSGLLATEAGTLGRIIGDSAITAFAIRTPPHELVNVLFFPFIVGLLISILLVVKFFDRLID